MGLGEIPPYFLGSLGRNLSARTEPPRLLGLNQLLRRIGGWIQTAMDRWDIFVVFGLAVIPNPLLEVSAISAGATEVPLKRFVPALVLGKLVRGLLLIFIGSRVF